jgi:bifunctional DNA-binding transcriptional regulator/antitoxin component of YhaV-PrlF toxin-antitoxin module
MRRTRPGLYVTVKAMPRISRKNQVTLPVEALAAAGLSAGDEVTIQAEGRDSIVVRPAPKDIDEALGVFDGLYEPGYLDRLREDWGR